MWVPEPEVVENGALGGAAAPVLYPAVSLPQMPAPAIQNPLEHLEVGIRHQAMILL
jgi:hypothetical protein